jgi:hypothetical protein
MSEVREDLESYDLLRRRLESWGWRVTVQARRGPDFHARPTIRELVEVCQRPSERSEDE